MPKALFRTTAILARHKFVFARHEVMGRAYRYVILGGGTAAGYAADEFVKRGVPRGELCIISEEQVVPYERPALSKGYLMPEGAVRLPVFHTCVGAGGDRHTAKWYDEHGIDVLLETRVVSADVLRKKVTTAAGETIQYTTLIVATGARALRLEEFGVARADSGRVCYLRDLRDADRLVATMAACKGATAVVIGGGYIGMEATAALVANGIRVTMVFPEPHCMPRLFTPEIAAFYERLYEEKGVKFIKGSVIVGFERDRATNNVTAVVLKDGQHIAADMVLVGIGIRPNTAPFEGQLAIDKGGIRVSPRMQTSDASVYAIGDVAAVPLGIYGGARRRLEHVDHARKSAAAAVQAIMAPRGAPSRYDYVPYFYSRVFDLSWQFYGDNVGECILFGDEMAMRRASGLATGSGAAADDASGAKPRGMEDVHLETSTPEESKKKEGSEQRPASGPPALSQPTSDSSKQGRSERKVRGHRLGAFWVDKGRLVGCFLEGGTKEEYEVLAAAARACPKVQDKAVLAKQGTQFLLDLVARGQLQATTGVAIAVGIVALAYWHGHKLRRLW
ncbi:unnamed protein product [Closterium sp. Yama58-4]|nr:unnamed protein product [Closterium sp. Yama58-4]